MSNTNYYLMKTFELTGTLRSEFGKKAEKAFRAQHLVPCNLYGVGNNTTFTVTTADVRPMIYTPDTLIILLTIGDKKATAVVKEMQFHPLSGDVLHIDFLEVTEQKPVTVEIPIQLTGHAEGVKAGGKLSQAMRKMKVNGIYTQFPDCVVVDVTSLGLGKKIAVSDVHIEGLTMMNPKDACVAEVKATRQSAKA